MVFSPPASYGLKSPTVEYLANSSDIIAQGFVANCNGELRL